MTDDLADCFAYYSASGYLYFACDLTTFGSASKLYYLEKNMKKFIFFTIIDSTERKNFKIMYFSEFIRKIDIVFYYLY